MATILRKVSIHGYPNRTVLPIHQITNGYGFIHSLKYDDKVYRVVFSIDNKTTTISWDGPEYHDFDFSQSDIYEKSSNPDDRKKVGILTALLKLINNFYMDKLVSSQQEYELIMQAVYPIHDAMVAAKSTKRTAKEVANYAMASNEKKEEVLDLAPVFKEELNDIATSSAIQVLQNTLDTIKSNSVQIPLSLESTAVSGNNPPVIHTDLPVKLIDRSIGVGVITFDSPKAPVRSVEVIVEKIEEKISKFEENETTVASNFVSGPRNYTSIKLAKQTKRRSKIFKTTTIKTINL